MDKHVKISDRIFNKFAEFIEKNLGIQMPEKKKLMLQARLQKRIRKLGLNSFEEYYKYVFRNGKCNEAELQEFINIVTTNKTEFFREPQHFSYLYRTVLPEFAEKRDLRNAPLGVWSAGCSSGEEPYTLAIVLSEFSRKHTPMNFHIIATDVSTEMLKTAANGIYKEEKIAPVAIELRKRYFLRSKDKKAGLVRVVRELREKISFKQLNFKDNIYSSIPDCIDIIFFRNVMIYFSQEDQFAILKKMCAKLIQGGFLFISHTESIRMFDLPLTPVAGAVFKKI